MPKSATQSYEEEKKMRFVKTLVLVAVVALAVSQMAAAEETKVMKNSLGLSAGYLMPTGSLDSEFVVGEVPVAGELKFEDTGLFGLAYQYRFNDKFSLGASLLYGTPDLRFTSADKSGGVGNATFMPLLLDANLHVLKRTGKVDFYLGPTVGYATWGDYKPADYADELAITESQPLKSDFVYGLNFALDVPFKSNWAFNANVRYLWAKAEQDTAEGYSVDVNPWILTLGVSYKF